MTEYSTFSSQKQPPFYSDTSAARPALGRYTDTVGAQSHKAIVKQDLLAAAKELLPDESRLQACMALIVDSKKLVSLEYADNTETPRARLTNVCRCDNPHICPNCGPIIAEQKKRLLQEDITVWDLEGFASCFVVFTLQHFAFERLVDVDERIDQALKGMFDSRPGRNFKMRWAVVGRSRSPDVTYGENGWHAHRNFIFYLERRLLSEKEREDFEAELSGLWRGAVAKVGGYADFDHGCKVRFDKVFDVADYIASKAMGHGTFGKGRSGPPDGWGQAEELTKSHLKQSGAGLTPTGLLLAYLWEDNLRLTSLKAGQLFQEYAFVFKGKKFVDTSPGFRARLNELKEKHQGRLLEILGQTELPDYKTLAYLGPEAFKQLIKLGMVLWLLEEVKANAGDPRAVKEFLEDAGITQVYYPTVDLQPPNWWYVEGGSEELVREIKRFNEFIKDWNDTGNF